MNRIAIMRKVCSGRMRAALYAGSFDPPSAGHLDIMKRTLNIVDKLYVGIAINPAKK